MEGVHTELWNGTNICATNLATVQCCQITCNVASLITFLPHLVLPLDCQRMEMKQLVNEQQQMKKEK